MVSATAALTANTAGPTGGAALQPRAEQRIAADLEGKPLLNRLDRTRPVAAGEIANNKAAQTGAGSKSRRK